MKLPLCIALIGCLLSVEAYANSGRILFVRGLVTVERQGKMYRAVPRAKVVQGDRIETPAGGRIHIRMSDRSLLSLRPDTNFVIEDYRFAGSARTGQRTAQAQTQAEPDRSVFRLIKGGFRAVTGLIGKRNPSAFSVNTIVATIGIRGTSFTASLEAPPSAGNVAQFSSDQMLASLDPAGLGLQAQSGHAGANLPRLKVGVGDGAVVLTNRGGTLVLRNGEFAVVSDPDTAPQLLDTQEVDPEQEEIALLEEEDAEDDTGDDAPKGQSNAGGGRAAATSPSGPGITSTTPTGGGTRQEGPTDVATPETEFIGNRREIAVSFANLPGAAGGDSFALAASDDASRVDGQGRLSAFIAPLELDGAPTAAVIENTDEQFLTAGEDRDTGLIWGRWSGSQTVVRFEDDTQATVDPALAQLHFVQSALAGGEPAVPSSGTRNYFLVGNTDPTDSAGNRGVLGTAALTANFSALTVQSQLELSIANQVWTATGQGALGEALAAGTPGNAFAGDYSSVQAGSAPGSGNFSGFFTQGAEAAGLSYILRSGGERVVGAAALQGE